METGCHSLFGVVGTLACSGNAVNGLSRVGLAEKVEVVAILASVTSCLQFIEDAWLILEVS